jgi:hypothetical protein
MTVSAYAPARRSRVLWLDVALAEVAALAYVLIGLGVLAVGDLAAAEAPAAIVYAAAGCYGLGGLLILARRRWLWAIGAAINALVIVFFAMAYQGRPAVLFSPGGVVTKAAQLLLEAGLLYLMVDDWRRSRRPTPRAGG